MKLKLLERIGEAEDSEELNPLPVEDNEVIHMSDGDQQELPTTKKMKSVMDILLGEEVVTAIAAKTHWMKQYSLWRKSPSFGGKGALLSIHDSF
uniref:Uncharacterized protein n=1 Tax=Amphimedon queenslandica TaxID=400682 RepID=A0A1X7VH88_AMPQE